MLQKEDDVMAADSAFQDRISESMKRRHLIRKLNNLILCAIILILGIASMTYKVRYEGGFLTCFREMSLCATVLTSITSAFLIFHIFYEIKIGSETTFRPLYYWRLSSAVTEMIVMLLVLIGYLPFIADNPVIARFDMINMLVIIPLVTIATFLFHDSPIGSLSRNKLLYGLLIITVYAVFILTLILTNAVPEPMIPYSILKVRNQPFWYILITVVVVYGGGYLLSWLFYALNLKLSWLWYRGVTQISE